MYLIFLTSKTLHLTSLITFQLLFLEILDLLLSLNSLHFTSLHFTSLHFTSLITFPTLFLKVLGLEGNFPEAFIASLFQSWMVPFAKEYFPISPICLLFLIF
jgi:hypothetical protein